MAMPGARLTRQGRFVLLWLLCIALPVQAGLFGRERRVVQDLHYGEVLFHFYQQDYFDAMTHLLAAQAQQRLPHHAEEAELLLGGMSLSWGMPDRAQEIFARLLDDNRPEKVRNRAWYYLARIAYQRGQYDKAESALSHVSGKLPKSLRGDVQLLQALVEIERGDPAAAAELLDKWKGPRALSGYARFNLGVALIRQGQLEAGMKQLDRLGDVSAKDEEHRGLRDKANLALALHLLRSDRPAEARRFLDRVRLSGPLSNTALLGAGWADSATGNHERALVAWTELLEREAWDPAVQEAWLAVPYAYSKLEARAQAARYYEQAVDTFDREKAHIDEAIAAIRSGKLLEALAAGSDTGPQAGWFWNAEDLPADRPETRYVTSLLAAHGFQEALKDYRDLRFLEHNLADWAERISAYDAMLETRQAAYEAHQPKVAEVAATRPADALIERHEALAAELEAVADGGDPMALASDEEQAAWAQLARAEARLAALPGNARTDALRDKLRVLKGVLSWRWRTEFPARLQATRQRLRALEAPLVEALDRQRALDEALTRAPQRFEGYAERIAALRARIAALQQGTGETRLVQGERLQQMAVAELEQRKARLDRHRLQARYALAVIYDQAALGEGTAQ